MSLKLPTRIGPYTVTELIGAGGMAEVYKAFRYGVDDFERPVAIKRILPNYAEDQSFITMFQAEAKLAGQLHHGNIAQIYNLGRHEDTFYMAIEYVVGKDVGFLLESAQKAGQHLPLPVVCEIISRVCEGLDYAHRKRGPDGAPLKIIHRDISPPNILVSFEGQVKVIDFGLAKAASAASFTQAGMIKGKLAYLSPEQVRAQPLDPRSDIFAIGIVFWELITTRRLFRRESDLDTFDAVRRCEIPPPSQIRPEVPPELEEVMMRALEVDRKHRFDSAASMRQHLEQVRFVHGLQCRREALGDWLRQLAASR